MNREPVQTFKEGSGRGCRVFLQHDSGQSILDSMEFGNGKLGSTVEERVTIVEPEANQLGHDQLTLQHLSQGWT